MLLTGGGKAALLLSHLPSGGIEQQKPVALCANDHISGVQPLLQVHRQALKGIWKFVSFLVVLSSPSHKRV